MSGLYRHVGSVQTWWVCTDMVGLYRHLGSVQTSRVCTDMSSLYRPDMVQTCLVCTDMSGTDICCHNHVGSVQTSCDVCTHICCRNHPVIFCRNHLSVCRANVSGKQRSDVGQTDICSRNRFRLWKGVSVDHLMDDAVIDAQIVGLEH